MKHILRRIIQVVFFITAMAIVFITARFIAHRYCPYAVVCFGIGGIHPSANFVFVEAIIAGLLILLATIVIGRMFCGYVCPFGTLAEYLNYLNPFRNKSKQIPLHIERKLRLVKYLILLFNAVMVGIFLNRIYNDACPLMTITMLTRPRILIPGIYLLVLIIVGSIIIMRFWCRYLCPYAALMNCLQYLGKLLKIKKLYLYRNLEVCDDCYLCRDKCQMNIDILELEYIDDHNCIHCLECIKVCPKNAITKTFK